MPPPAAEPPPASGGGPPGAAIVSFVGAGVLAAAFAVLAPLSEAEDQALASRCGRDAGRVCDPSELGTLEALDIAADVSWIGALALGALGVVLLVALPGEAHARGRVTVRTGPGWANLDIGGSF